MKKQELDRRDFLKGAVVGGAAAAGGTAAIATPEIALAQQAAPAAPAAPAPAGYAFLNLDEAAFVEALVDHMIPADEVSPKGTDLGVNIYIDRALAGGWGKGDRLYMQGPWKQGAPSQGYQLPLTPAELYRTGIAAATGALPWWSSSEQAMSSPFGTASDPGAVPGSEVRLTAPGPESSTFEIVTSSPSSACVLCRCHLLFGSM